MPSDRQVRCLIPAQGARPSERNDSWRYHAVVLHLYQKAGLEGVSSHSGRRTFATEAVKRAHNFHGSIVTVQRLLGHARLETTGAYIEPSADTIALVSSL